MSTPPPNDLLFWLQIIVFLLYLITIKCISVVFYLIFKNTGSVKVERAHYGASTIHEQPKEPCIHCSLNPYQQRARWRWQTAGRRHGPECSSSWFWRWVACFGHRVCAAAGPRWAVQWPEPERPVCPWSDWPRASALLLVESPMTHTHTLTNQILHNRKQKRTQTREGRLSDSLPIPLVHYHHHQSNQIIIHTETKNAAQHY